MSETHFPSAIVTLTSIWAGGVTFEAATTKCQNPCEKLTTGTHPKPLPGRFHDGGKISGKVQKPVKAITPETSSKYKRNPPCTWCTRMHSTSPLQLKALFGSHSRIKLELKATQMWLTFTHMTALNLRMVPAMVRLFPLLELLVLMEALFLEGWR